MFTLPAAKSTSSSEGDLHRIISDYDIEVVARDHLALWEGLPLLNPAEEVVIRKNLPSDYLDQKRKFLFKWKENQGDKATYRELSNAATTIGNKALADVLEDLGHRSQGKVCVSARVHGV